MITFKIDSIFYVFGLRYSLARISHRFDVHLSFSLFFIVSLQWLARIRSSELIFHQWFKYLVFHFSHIIELLCINFVSFNTYINMRYNYIRNISASGSY